MGIAVEKLVLDQLKKGQGETNERLDRLIAAIDRQNDLLQSARMSKTTSAE